MTWSFHTGCKYHTQDTGYYCGAAAAMMVLAEIGLPHASMNQDDLYTSNHSHNVKAGWATDPYGLRFTLVDRKPAAFTNTFVVYKPETEAEGTRKIVYTLWHYQVSPIVLVYHCMHWIVVRGVQTDVEPTPGAAYTVTGLWVNNPVFRDNDPHTATDVCGTGGVNGVQAQWVSYADWQATYFTGCNYDSATGASQFISVCDPDEPRIELPRRRNEDHPLDGREIASRDVAVELVHAGIERNDLRKAELLGPVRDARFDTPVLVKRLDRPDSYYYLVHAMLEDGVIGFGQVDALLGDLQSVFVLDKPIKPYQLDRARMLRGLLRKPLELGEPEGRFRLRPDTFCVAPTLVWRPCRESFSPHLPFWQITAGSQTVYVRVDGAVFTTLTSVGAGV